MQLFVGNLPYTTTESELEELFGTFGEVLSVKIISDRYTGKSRGFGFVEMSDPSAAKNAISDLNDSDTIGRKIVVKEANEKERAPRGDRPDRPSRGPREGNNRGGERRQRDY